MNKKILILAASIIFHFSFVTGNDYTILSPDKSIKLLVEIGDKITYSVYYNGIVLPTHMAKMCDQRGGEFDLERLKMKTVLKKKPYLSFTFFHVMHIKYEQLSVIERHQITVLIDSGF